CGGSRRRRTDATSARWPSPLGSQASVECRCSSATWLHPSHLLLPQQQVDDPTATHMRTRLTQMGDELVVAAAGIFEGVREDGKAVSVERAGGQVPLFVSGRRECCHGRRPPSRIDGDGTEGVAEKTAKQTGLFRLNFSDRAFRRSL